MKKQLIRLLFCAGLLLGLLTVGAAAGYSGTPKQPDGSGTAESPYLISSAEELYWFAGLVNGTLADGTTRNPAAYATLTKDITINQKVLDETGALTGNTDGLETWTPIGDADNPYTGAFDGGGHTISGLYVDITTASGNAYAGLFGFSSGTIQNVKLADSYVGAAAAETNALASAGGICGNNNGTITDCSSEGAVTAEGNSAYAGGICGYNDGTITNCASEGAVTAEGNSARAGGICGYNLGGTITNCSSGGAVKAAAAETSAEAYAGGICGWNAAIITDCSSKGDVTAEGPAAGAGGICGYNYYSGTITNCASEGDVKAAATGDDGKAHAGGICGRSEGAASYYYPKITNCTNEGAVTAEGNSARAGGICGTSDGTITNCASEGAAVNAKGTYSVCAGGICGYNSYSGTITNCASEGDVEATVTGTGSYVVAYAGGICGYNGGGTITNCASGGAVTEEGTTASAGGICGYSWSGSITTCYFLENGELGGVGGGFDTTTEAEAKTEEEFYSGQVAWLLDQWVKKNPGNDPELASWAQNLEEKDTPRPILEEADEQYAVVKMTVKFPDATSSPEKEYYTNIEPVLNKCPVRDDGGTVYEFYEDSAYNNRIDIRTTVYREDTVIYAKAGTAITSISLSQTDMDLDVGDAETLTATIEPDSASYKDYLIWESGNEAVATVDLNGEVTARGVGSTTITATAIDGSGKYDECTVTVTQPVTGITLSQTDLSLFTGESGTLTAMVTPANASNKAVTWSSNNTDVATVENGVVTARGVGSATITATATDGSGEYDECTVMVTQSTYRISADTESWDFGTVTEGYTQAPAAKTVTITNTGNQTVTVDLPTSTNYTVTAGTGFTNGNAALSPGREAQFTVQPKTGLSADTYQETLEMTGTYGVRDDVELRFVVTRPTGGGSSGGGSTTTPTISQQIITKIKAAKDGDTVEITLKPSQTKLDKEVFETLSGRDVTLVLHLDGEVDWTIYGQDIAADAVLTDLDMGVSMNTTTIPVDLINAITGEIGTVQITLAHDGEFGFVLTLTAPLGAENEGLWANLYRYDESAGAMTFQTAALVDEDGNVALRFTHASEYAIVLDDKSHELPFTDLTAGAWYWDAVAYVYRHDIMAGYGDNLFGPNDDLSRAQLCQIVYNMEGQPTASGGGTFNDVADGAWYFDAVTWAASQGIVGGYGNGKFGPDDAITREQLATILYRYAQAKGYDVSVGEDTNILSYTDAQAVSEYAIPAMQWACGTGIIQGNGGYLNPQGDATRAEIATMLMRFCGYYANTK